MVKAKYSAMQEKLDNLAEKHELIYIWDTVSPHITLTVKPKALETEQTSFIADDEDDKSSSDAAISFIFKNGEIIINTVGKLFITEALIGKFKNIAKKMHYLYLQLLHEETFDADVEQEDDAEEVTEDEPECPEYDDELDEF